MKLAIGSFFLVVIASFAHAGTCDQTHVESLELIAGAQHSDAIEQGVSCLSIPFWTYHIERERLLERGRIQGLAKTYEDAKERAAVVLPAQLKKAKGERCHVAEAMALFRIEGAYEALETKCEADGRAALAFAAIGGPKSLTKIKTIYRQAAKRKSDRALPHLLSALNALNQFPEKEVLPVLEELKQIRVPNDAKKRLAEVITSSRGLRQ